MYRHFRTRSRIILFFYSFLATSFFSVSLNAQNYNFRSYSLEEGLSQSEVNCIFEDSRGYLWMGTAGGGLNRFDGVNFVSYEENDGLAGQIVSVITEDKNGHLWIGTTWGGISEFDGKSFTKLTVKEGLLSNNISALLFDEDNKLLIGTSDGLTVYDPFAPEGKMMINFVKDEKTFVPIKVRNLTRDKSGNIWVGCETGMYLWKNKKLTNLTASYRQLNGNILSVAVDKDGSVMVAESPNIFYHAIQVKSTFLYQIEDKPVIHTPIKTSVSAIYFDHRNRLWITTLGDGIIRIQDGKETLFNKTNGLTNNIVASICEDASGNIWFGTKGEGVMKYRDDQFSYFENVEGLKEGDIFAINKDEKGKMWVGTSTNGAFVFDPLATTGNKVKNLNSNKDIADSRTSCFYFAPNGDTWIGTSKGMIIYNGTSFRKLKLCDTNDIVPIRAMYVDKNKDLWIGTNGYGVIRMKDGKPQFFTGTTLVNVYSFAEDNSGTLFIGGGSGLYKFENEKIISTRDSGLCNVYIGSMIKDKFGHLWVGTDKCVAYYDGKFFHSYSIKEGLTSSTVYLMNVDEEGNIWVGTNKGMDRLKVTADGKIASVKNFNRAEGFKGIECNSRATFRDKDGCLYYGTVKGLIKYDPKESMPDTTAPKVHITAARVFFEDLDWQKFGDSLVPWFNLPVGHDLSYGQNHLTFDFIGISKTIPEGIKYKFKLEGFDEDWNLPTSQTSVTYSNLPAGVFTFKVIACNNDGKWNEYPAEFKFTILAPFWRTTGFILFCTLILGISIFYYNRLRKLQIKKRNLVLERMVKVRTSELQKQKEEREVLLKEIHHRVKNNLQIVNSLINIQSANIKDPDALAVFEESKNKIKSIALIHERLYRGSDMSNIEIGDYLNELLKSLVDTYSVSKEIKLVTDLKVKKLNLNTVIPLGLLLNELISNSIKYAFGKMDKGCEIYIQLKASGEEMFEMIIGDNGEGFDTDPFVGENTTLGLELVKILVDQLDGTIKKMDKEGTYYFIQFKRAKS